jgi:hypothetical protein
VKLAVDSSRIPPALKFVATAAKHQDQQTIRHRNGIE